MISHKRKVDNGVYSEGLLMTTLPARKAGMICQTAIMSGQFHGVIEATTPSGWRWRSIRLVSLSSITSTGKSIEAA
ncbi:Uncharacterised protein [Acinetobacter baumannii]|nr:Uncharacterised protein [Acinetobacter baumannii]